MTSGAPTSGLQATITPTSNPLVARFTLQVPANTRTTVEFGTDPTYGRATAPVPAPPGGGPLSILVAGMLPSTTYHMSALIQWNDGRWLRTADQTFGPTGALPVDILPTVAAAPVAGQSPSPGVELVNVIDPIGISVVTDLHGSIIWYYDNVADKPWKGYAFPIKPLPNGHFLASITNLYQAGVTPEDYDSVLREIDLAGAPIRELWLADLRSALASLKTPQGSIVDPLVYSHDVVPLWNGHTLLIVQQRKKVWLNLPPGPGEFDILGDAVVDLDENFQPVWVWSVFDNLDPDRHPYEFDKSPDDWDWTHCNCVQLTPDDNLLLSVRNQNWVLKIHYAGGTGDGAILWKLGYQGDFTLTGVATSDTDWFFAQHYPHILAVNGPRITRFSVMDNGNDRCFATSEGCAATDPAPPPPFTRGAIFTLDETAMTASLEWEYREPLFGHPGVDAYSFWGGNVVELINGDVEICASEPVAVGGPIPAQDAPSQVIELSGPVSDPVVVWQMTVQTGGAYRAYRIPSLYPGVIWKR